MWEPDYRHAFRGALGERSLGALLELGPERDLGGSDLAGQSAVYTLPVSEEQTIQGSPWNTGVLFYLAASLLVRCKLSTFGTGQQRARI